MIKELVPRSRYGPPGLAERVYDDLYGPYGPNAIRSQPPQFLRTRSAEGFAKGHRGYGSVRTLAVAGRIQTPPHDMTAAQPHPSGHSLSFTGTWRASGKEHQDSGMSSARECVHRLLTGTTPAPASRPAVRTQIVPRPLQTSLDLIAFHTGVDGASGTSLYAIACGWEPVPTHGDDRGTGGAASSKRLATLLPRALQCREGRSPQNEKARWQWYCGIFL